MDNDPLLQLSDEPWLKLQKLAGGNLPSTLANVNWRRISSPPALLWESLRRKIAVDTQRYTIYPEDSHVTATTIAMMYKNNELNVSTNAGISYLQ